LGLAIHFTFLIKLLYLVGVWFETLTRIKEQTPQRHLSLRIKRDWNKYTFEFIFLIYNSTLNSQTCTSDYRNQISEGLNFVDASYVNLLEQHKFCCANLIGRRWRK
jgi:hypothetical protein